MHGSDRHPFEDAPRIAVIGMSCRVPGADNVEEFWQNLVEARESISQLNADELRAAGVSPSILGQPGYVGAAGMIRGVDQFDAAFFGFAPREAQVTDPQHRIFLECCWEALEGAGYDPKSYAGRIGVFGGCGLSGYLLYHVMPRMTTAPDLENMFAFLGNVNDFLCTATSYKLGLGGPSVTVQSACSTSLVALHIACQSLLNGECDIALAGGVQVLVPRQLGHVYRTDGIGSADGRCRAFDAEATGTVSGSGTGVVVIKRLDDALRDGDQVWSVILGTAINNDGAARAGFTAPSVEGQARAIAEALAVAGIEPNTVTYIEAHGTGTKLGDPIEVAALATAFGPSEGNPSRCAIGSVKTSIGHLGAAAGIAGVIKTVLALRHKTIPASLNFKRPNPALNLARTPFYVCAQTCPWKTDGGAPRRAGVSSFGIGGTNAHVVLEEPPEIAAGSASRRLKHLVVLSARTSTALELATERLVHHLKKHLGLDLADVAYTLQAGRRPFEHRRAVVCGALQDAGKLLEARDPDVVISGNTKTAGGTARIAFMFPGLGEQYVDMARGIYRTEPVFRDHLDYCLDRLRGRFNLDLLPRIYPKRGEPGDAQASQGSHGTTTAPGIDLRRLLTPNHARQRALDAQPLLFAVEYALAQLWFDWGVQPNAMIGHSLGDYVAACLAGVFELDDALFLITEMARLIDTLPQGGMLAVCLPEAEARSLLTGSLELAALNGENLCVIAGSDEDLVSLRSELVQRHVAYKLLDVSQALHSTSLQPVADSFGKLLRQVKLSTPRIPCVSSTTGCWLSPTQATDPDYWVQHSLRSILFLQGIRTLRRASIETFVEMGTGTLCSFVRACPEAGRRVRVLQSLPHPFDACEDHEQLLKAVADLWVSGREIAWTRMHLGEHRLRIPLPTYPFERRRYWIDAPSDAPSKERRASEFQRPMFFNAIGVNESEPPLGGRDAALSSVGQPASQDLHDVEQSLIAIWKEVLGVETLAASDDFFDLSGNSLLALRVLARIRDRYNLDLPLRSIFQARTISKLAAVVVSEQAMSDEGRL